MRPDLSHRIIDGVLFEHLKYLQQTHLYESFAALRKVCAELGYEKVLSLCTSEPQESSLARGDSYAVSRTCFLCRAPMENGRTVCARCRKISAVCPLCTSVTERGDHESATTLVERPLWTYCQACGHSAHDICMENWFPQGFSEGHCPTVGCGCDCAPGRAREERIAKQRQAYEESKLIVGRLSSTKKDPFRALQSPAVDKTRAALRASSGERGTQSSDERGKLSRKSSTRQSVGGFASSRKSVRLVTPSEESSSGSTARPLSKESVTKGRVGARPPRRD